MTSNPTMPRRTLCKAPNCRNVEPCREHPGYRETLKAKNTPLGNLYRSKAWAATRRYVLARDGHTCHYCRKTGQLPTPGGRLIAAHLDQTKQLLEHGLDPHDTTRIVTAHQACAERHAPALQARRHNQGGGT